MKILAETQTVIKVNHENIVYTIVAFSRGLFFIMTAAGMMQYEPGEVNEIFGKGSADTFLNLLTN